MIIIMKNNYFICPRQQLSQRLVGPSKHLKQTNQSINDKFNKVKNLNWL